MKKISLRDQHFAHVKTDYSSDFQKSEKMIWSRVYPYDTEVTVFTHMSMGEVQNLKNKINIAWALEPYEVWPSTYTFLLKAYHNYDLVISHDKDFIKYIPNGVLLPYGDCWIKKEDWFIYDKTKNCSTVCSNKRMTPQHEFRHKCLQVDGIDEFGFMNPIEYKLTALKEYKFHVVVENSKRNDWFTEKLLDCFATGTVPIYCGFSNIGNYFDLSGIITFSTIEELSAILDKIQSGEIKYEQFISGIKANFWTFQKYAIKEDLLLKTIEDKGWL